MASANLHDALTSLGIPHVYERYPTGCHSAPNFERQITATFGVFTNQLTRHAAPPTALDYRAVEPSFDVFGWDVSADPDRALEFLQLHADGSRSFTLAGSGRTHVTTPALFAAGQTVTVSGATPDTAVADAAGRLHLVVDLGPANAKQQYTLGAATVVQERTVLLAAPINATSPATASLALGRAR